MFTIKSLRLFCSYNTAYLYHIVINTNKNALSIQVMYICTCSSNSYKNSDSMFVFVLLKYRNMLHLTSGALYITVEI